MWVVCNIKTVDTVRFEASCLLQFLHSNAAPEVFSLHNGGLCEGLLSRQGGNYYTILQIKHLLQKEKYIA